MPTGVEGEVRGSPRPDKATTKRLLLNHGRSAGVSNRKGFGWKRWSRRRLYDGLQLFNGYRVRRLGLAAKWLAQRTVYQFSSASRFTAAQAGFLLLSQSRDRPDR
jgi:hypothetical protein